MWFVISVLEYSAAIKGGFFVPRFEGGGATVKLVCEISALEELNVFLQDSLLPFWQLVKGLRGHLKNLNKLLLG